VLHPKVIREAVDGCTKPPVSNFVWGGTMDLYARLKTVKPFSAAATFLAHETHVANNAARNQHITGSWDLFNRGKKIGSVSFKKNGRVDGLLRVECEESRKGTTEEEILAAWDVVPQFGCLNVASLTYETSHRICGKHLDGKLAIHVIDEDNFEGELHASAQCGVSSGDTPYGLEAEFTGRRRDPTQQTSDPSSAAATVPAHRHRHETRVAHHAARNRHITGAWDLFNEGTRIGSVSFQKNGRVDGLLRVVCEVSPEGIAEEEVLTARDVVPQFDSLNVALLAYETSHRVCDEHFDGGLTIQVIDKDNFEGELHASTKYGVSGRDAPYGLEAEFIGRRRVPTQPASPPQ